MDRKMAVLGAGAIGSSVGADLARAGHDVALIDQWPAHVEAMKAHGLHVMMPEEELHTPVQALHLCELCTIQRQFDIVFLAAKSYDTPWMVQLIKPYLKPGGVLVSLQNSLNDEWIIPELGYQRDIASVVELAANLFEPGRVRRFTPHGRTWFALGEIHGRETPRLQEVAGILNAAGKTEISTNIWGAKWSKLVVNSMTAGVSGILGTPGNELIRRPEIRRLFIKLGRESLQVGLALGYSLEPLFGLTAEEILGSTDEVLEKILLTLFSKVSKGGRSMILQDHLKGRRSEIDYINGLVVRKGREAGVPTPLNEAITSLTRQIEQGVLKPTLSNAAVLEH